MFVSRTKHIPESVFMSFSDETKIRMTNNQVYVYICDDEEDDWQTVFSWLCDNVSNSFAHGEEKDDDGINLWLYFYEESDMVAFKIRWAS